MSNTIMSEKNVIPYSEKKLEEKREQRKYQYREDFTRKGGRSKICKSTKTKDHAFVLVESTEHFWKPLEQKQKTIIHEYRCGCGKKKMDFEDKPLTDKEIEEYKLFTTKNL